jgi:hypothetical protein
MTGHKDAIIPNGEPAGQSLPLMPWASRGEESPGSGGSGAR